ncbi:hypothetical protein TREMEDRAFT_65609 [Tremella mesenterica DSM 1558]|uniref:uncharacterized protein n=1 Tax=Tremella mesenterica (strain ATCC 24925 / CBS 8224 / DSM 1558 / NBRC 9311 / NRRL Y-6157 / RJB 2259-6 / UBC 559-6) TaxID=578456 RepID=UPI00032CC416|nr:uncharacterized protein TREMEDRAFT_65609 [Tremella mesenterica DSM 1558]EIW66334.1 hypothetical protein TREMEDRAFT_65609 [Tremella mesenterica DSM 1558]
MDLETAYQMAFLATINDTEFWDKQKQITPWVLGEARERLKQSLLAAQRSWLQARRINPDTFKERSYYEFKFSKSSSDETFLWKCSGAVQLWGHSPQVFNSSSAGYPVKGRLSGLGHRGRQTPPELHDPGQTQQVFHSGAEHIYHPECMQYCHVLYLDTVVQTGKAGSRSPYTCQTWHITCSAFNVWSPPEVHGACGDRTL